MRWRAHHRLHGLRQHVPARVEVGGDARGVGFELAQAAQAGLVAEQAVAERDAHVAKHRRVGEVALPARHGELLGQVAKQGVGQAQVAFEFSKSIGFTLCGIVEEPTSPAFTFWRK